MCLHVPLVSAKLYSSMFGPMAICSTYWQAYLISGLVCQQGELQHCHPFCPVDLLDGLKLTSRFAYMPQGLQGRSQKAHGGGPPEAPQEPATPRAPRGKKWHGPSGGHPKLLTASRAPGHSLRWHRLCKKNGTAQLPATHN